MGSTELMPDKTDYSPVVEPAGEAEKRRERRKWAALLGGAHLFWLYALVLAGIVLVLYFVLR
jgi:cell division septal protein FtsQ